MSKKQMMFKTRGMNRDLSVSAFNPEFSFENVNLRLMTNEGNTGLSWVNERGTLEMAVSGDALKGIPIGTAVINSQLVVFTTTNTEKTESTLTDRIYVLTYANDEKTELQSRRIYKGKLNLSTQNPLETLVYFESEYVQKVYWTDGRNQPRFVNICMEPTSYSSNKVDTEFDFVSSLTLEETVRVKKLLGTNGMFASGVIQYAFTYFRKYGQESNIFYVSPLQYISPKERGAAPDERIGNSFRITIENVDLNYDSLRIYSIQRTSIDGVPFCKRVVDVSLKGLSNRTVSYTDTGLTGDSIDPMELLYKGGETIIASTLEQKDNVLFLGNLKTTRPKIEASLKSSIESNVMINNQATRGFDPIKVSEGYYSYYNQLTSEGIGRMYDSTVPCCGFKTGDYYRLGVQFQHESGKWSDPIYLNDYRMEANFYEDTGYNSGRITVPIFEGIIPQGDLISGLMAAGYKKVRGVVVYPSPADRETICQGVSCPTVFTDAGKEDGSLRAQASWFFRPMTEQDDQIEFDKNDVAISPKSTDYLRYYTDWKKNGDEETQVRIDKHVVNSTYEPWYLRQVEIQGNFKDENKFQVDRKIRTLHSPDIEFDDQLVLTDLNGLNYHKVGQAWFDSTMSDINIETSTPTVSNKGAGFIHKPMNNSYSRGIVAGLFYEDFLVDDDVMDSETTGAYPRITASPKWMVYPWHCSGYLNNDFDRPVDQGVGTAKLKKKVISNLRHATTTYMSVSERLGTDSLFASDFTPQLFNSDENTILKFKPSMEHTDSIYRGNIDTILTPDYEDGNYFAFDGWTNGQLDADIDTPFNSTAWCKTRNLEFYNEVTVDDETKRWNTTSITRWIVSGIGISWIYGGPLDKWLPGPTDIHNDWGYDANADWVNDIGETYVDLVSKKLDVRMKYKSTPHILFGANVNDGLFDELRYDPVSQTSEDRFALNIFELRQYVSESTRFGGNTIDALKANVWIPCGEPVRLDNITTVHSERGDYDGVLFYYDYGDTYYQRYDCLKTYAYTPEDINQVVEIGSFMLESRVNTDGRYDRNRGQSNNLNMSPQNFNLMNSVYSQKNNFFTYKIMDEDTYTHNSFPNQITWSLTKESGTEVDRWTNVTLASVMELDGDKGSVNKLVRFNNQLLAFQDKGISHILYNENAAVSTTAGVPVELANSGKVQGKDYLSNTIGCSNKWSMQSTPSGIYFMDNNDKSIYLFNGQLVNLSQQGGLNSWCKQEIPSVEKDWTPLFVKDYDDKTPFVAHYDKMNQDVMFTNGDTSLAWNEKLQVFTSFYDYGHTPYLCSLDDTCLWIKSDHSIWKHHAGEYCNFFGINKPYSMTLVGNPEPTLDKIFTNLEFRACVSGEGRTVVEGQESDSTSVERYEPYLPFDYLETWNEYQHGRTKLMERNGHSAFQHHTSDGISSLKRKFRIWRCDIPRDNADNIDVFDETFSKPFHVVPRQHKHPLDRMRNPWIYLKLRKGAADVDNVLPKTEVHDVVMTYFG